jgi:hypothetical protein
MNHKSTYKFYVEPLVLYVMKECFTDSQVSLYLTFSLSVVIFSYTFQQTVTLKA